MKAHEFHQNLIAQYGGNLNIIMKTPMGFTAQRVEQETTYYMDVENGAHVYYDSVEALKAESGVYWESCPTVLVEKEGADFRNARVSEIKGQ